MSKIINIIAFETASGATHVVVATTRGQYYGRFERDQVSKLARLESGLQKVRLGSSVRINLLDGNDAFYRWTTTAVTFIRESTEFSFLRERGSKERLVADYALYQDYLVEARIATG